MPESYYHKELVQEAKKHLIDWGFKEEEIQKEFGIETKTFDYSTYTYYVDIIGKNKDRFVMIECGNVDSNKINFLRQQGDLYILPYTKEKEVVLLKVSAESCSISLRKDQIRFIEEQRREFNLSKFVQSMLDDYIKDFNYFKLGTEEK